MNSQRLARLILALSILIAACDNGSPAAPSSDVEAAPAQAERGPNNGRLLRDGEFELELAIFETGIPPEFRAWTTIAGKPVEPQAVDLKVTLTRLGSVDVIGFHPEGDFLRS